jgi:hypothetical protein
LRRRKEMNTLPFERSWNIVVGYYEDTAIHKRSISRRMPSEHASDIDCGYDFPECKNEET